jgi:hypothetical protein
MTDKNKDKIFLVVSWIAILIFTYLFWSIFIGWLLK